VALFIEFEREMIQVLIVAGIERGAQRDPARGHKHQDEVKNNLVQATIWVLRFPIGVVRNRVDCGTRVEDFC
jgi:hypothetical protein